ncbi:MAG: Do/DeqQ family serine protease [Motiliproteus sp.]|jgi:Do/DeqQ family serine protease
MMKQRFHPIKSPIKSTLFAATLSLVLFTTSSLAGLPLSDAQGRPLPSLAPLLKTVTPAVVNISTLTRLRASNPLLDDPFFRRFFNLPPQLSSPRQRQTQSAGSGVIIDAKQGWVVTNYHVVEDADEIHIGLTDGRDLQATLVGSDPDADLALLKIEATRLTEIPLANSAVLQVGDFVVAIGNPFGLGQTVTTGIVSALGRTGLGIEGYENFIQTDASINPGNSGGALINLRGELVGINTAIIAPGGGNVGIGFAIPSNMTQAIIQQLAANGEVRRGRLGVIIQDLSPDLAEAFGLQVRESGVLVSEVVDNSAADKAGIRAGDVVLKVNGETIRNTAELRSKLGVWLIGSSLTVDLLRDSRRFQEVVALDLPGQNLSEGERYNPLLTGAILAEDGDGVLLQSIAPDSPAALTGLRPGDRILAVNRTKVSTLDEFAQAAERKLSTLLLLIDHDGSSLYLSLPNR